MAEMMTGPDDLNPWGELLQQARLALTNLRSCTLEELADRADCMLAAAVGGDPVRQRVPRPELRGRPEVVREYGLLRDLLRATDRNLKVLRRSRGGERADAASRELRHEWVR